MHRELRKLGRTLRQGFGIRPQSDNSRPQVSRQTVPAVARTTTPLQEKLTTARRNYAYIVQQLRGLELDPDEYEDALHEARYGLQRRVHNIMETEL